MRVVHRGLSLSATAGLCLKVGQSRTCAPRPDRSPAGAPSRPIVILQALPVFACLIAPAMTLAQSSFLPPVAPREPHDVTCTATRGSTTTSGCATATIRARSTYLQGRERLRRRLVRAARGAEREALPGDVRADPAGRRLGADRKGDWWYSSRTRRRATSTRATSAAAPSAASARFDPAGHDETLLDLNAMARGQPFLRLGLSAVTLDADTLAYTLDLTGGRDFTLHVKDLATGEIDAWSVRRSRRRPGPTTAAPSTT